MEIHRSGLYYQAAGETALNLELMELIDRYYLDHADYGVRRFCAWLRKKGYGVNPKRIRRLMRKMGLQAIYPKKSTSRAADGHHIYPYLLGSTAVRGINQAWAADITYVRMKKGYMYLLAIIDLYSRYVINWSISNTMSSSWCSEVLKEALIENRKPEIFNTDQGSQFTCDLFTNVLKENGIKISMDSKGRASDNIFIERLWRSVKYENIYMYHYETGMELYQGLKRYFEFYNNERVHQSLAYRTPAEIYFEAA